MKKLRKSLALAIVLAMCLSLFSVCAFADDDSYEAAIDGTEYATLAAAVKAAEAGATVTFLKDVSLGSTALTIDKELTLDGDGHAISADDGYVIEIPVADEVVLENITLNAGANGVHLGKYSGGPIGETNVTLSHCTIQKTGVSDYDTSCMEFSPSMTIGVGIHSQGGTITIEDTTIQGFQVSVNVLKGTHDVTMNVIDGAQKGRTALNLMADDCEITYSDVTVVVGMNSQGQTTKGAAFVVCKTNSPDTTAERDTLTINGCEIKVVDGTNPAFLTALNNEITLNITGDTRYIFEEGRGGLDEHSAKNVDRIQLDATAYAGLADIIQIDGVYGCNDKDYTVRAVNLVRYQDVPVNLYDAFDSLADGETITLLRDAKLTKDVEFSDEVAHFTLDLNGNAFNRGDYAFEIPAGVTIAVDQKADGLFSAPDGYLVKEVETDGAAIEYTVVEAVAVTYVYENGEDDETVQIEKGTRADVPETPEKEHYIFDGWYDGAELFDFESPVDESVLLTAKWTPAQYKITFADEDGAELASYDVEYGATPVYEGATPAKASSSRYYYTFKGWTPEIVPVEGEATYAAEYNAVRRAVDSGSSTPAPTPEPAPDPEPTPDPEPEIIDIGDQETPLSELPDGVNLEFDESGVTVWIDDGEVPLADAPITFADADEIPAWNRGGIAYVAANRLMQGYPDGSFGAGLDTDRAMIATVLMRMAAGKPEGTGSFKDVTADQYYAEAAAWAVENGIFEGFEDGTFRGEQTITREQLVTVLYRYAKRMGYDTAHFASLEEFTDGEAVAPYAAEAMQWAVKAGLITGVGGGAIDPAGGATRGQVATILMRFRETFGV